MFFCFHRRKTRLPAAAVAVGAALRCPCASPPPHGLTAPPPAPQCRPWAPPASAAACPSLRASPAPNLDPAQSAVSPLQCLAQEARLGAGAGVSHALGFAGLKPGQGGGRQPACGGLSPVSASSDCSRSWEGLERRVERAGSRGSTAEAGVGLSLPACPPRGDRAWCSHDLDALWPPLTATTSGDTVAQPRTVAGVQEAWWFPSPAWAPPACDPLCLSEWSFNLKMGR